MTRAILPVGAQVRVRLAFPPGHIRAPFYIRGQLGQIERYCGHCPNPEERAVMRDGLPALALYRVRFRQQEIWPNYRGAPADTIEIELYENWLEPVAPTANEEGARHAA